MAPIEISLNGERRHVDASYNIADLLAEIGIETGKIAVERNEMIVPRSRYRETALHHGDSLEIVHFIGGG